MSAWTSSEGADDADALKRRSGDRDELRHRRLLGALVARLGRGRLRLALRGGVPISSVLFLEGNLTAARPDQTFGTSTILIPELQVQLHIPFGNLMPYLGLGAGGAFDFRPGDVENAADLTISGSLGARWWLNQRFGLTFEFRARGMGTDFAASSALAAAAEQSRGRRAKKRMRRDMVQVVRILFAMDTCRGIATSNCARSRPLARFFSRFGFARGFRAGGMVTKPQRKGHRILQKRANFPN